MGRSQRGNRDPSRSGQDRVGDNHYPGVGVAESGAVINPALTPGSRTAYTYSWSAIYNGGLSKPVSYSPADDAVDVAVGADLVIVFSKSMDTTAASSVTLKNVGGADIEVFDTSTDGTWSTTTSANDTWTVSPTSSFTNAATLAVRYSGFVDFRGLTVPGVDNDTSWNFTVVAA
jgi:hypothetical protein